MDGKGTHAMRKMFGLTAAGLLAAGAATGYGGPVERKVYAHFMGCWPANSCMTHERRNVTASVKGERPEDYCSAVGGRIVNLPLLPYDAEMDLLTCAKLEIRRAIRAGIDGFAFDAWAGDTSPQIMDTYFQAAEELKVDFGITICFDNSCHGAKWITGEERWERFVCSAHRVLDPHKDSPNLARFHGKPLFFGYGSGWIVDFREGESAAALRARVKDAWRKWRKALPCEVYLHGCVGKFVDTNRPEQNDWPAIARDCAETFDTVGSFLGFEDRWGTAYPIWKYVKDAGCGWSQPLFWQYDNKAGGIISHAGLDYLHEAWRLAIERGSELLQFVTWNDYGEETILAPAYGSNYTITRVNRWYADRWKSGRDPEVDEDEVHVVFRKTVGDAPSFPFLARRQPLPQELEVLTILKAPGTVQVKGYGSYEAPKGLFYRRFPLKAGIVAARVRRGEKTVCGVLAPERVSEKRWREDMTSVAYGSNYESEWKLDFPDVAPWRYSEMGDEDKDGLPNWFEMVYFGTFPDMRTATCADPAADPDGDGLTNLEEYRGNTDPRVKDVPPVRGETWKLSGLVSREKYIANPMRDARGNYVWRFTYRFGAEGESYKTGGDPFVEIESAGGSLHHRRFHVYLPNPKQGNRKVGGFDSGVIFEGAEPDAAQVRVHHDTPIAIEWISPVDGTVACRVETETSETPFRVVAEADGRKVGAAQATEKRGADLTVSGVKVRKGATVRFVFVSEESGNRTLGVKDITVTLK